MCEDGLHDPFTDQVECARYRAERDALAQRMEEVASEIDRTLSGVEGIEDAPAMRWMRGLREALGALHSPRTSYEDIEAAKWVRGHGGLDEVNRKVAESMRQDDEYIALRCSLAERAGDLYEMLDKEDDELVSLLDKRLMPEGCEWPTVDGRKVDFKTSYQPSLGVLEAVSIYNNGAVEVMSHDGIIKPVSEIHVAVLAADGEPLEVGQMVWDENGDEFRVLDLYGGPVDEDFPDHTVRCRRAGAEEYESTMCAPSQLTHQRPVLDADGVPIKKGDTVWCVATDDELTDMSIIWTNWSKMREKLTVKSFTTDVHGDKWADFEETFFCVKTRYLTHAKPEPPDSWERVEDDCSISERDYYAQLIGHDVGLKDDEEVHRAVSLDLVRRCKALAERERGE